MSANSMTSSTAATDFTKLESLLATRESDWRDIVDEFRKFPLDKLEKYLTNHDCLRVSYVDKHDWGIYNPLLIWIATNSRTHDPDHKLLQMLLNAGTDIDVETFYRDDTALIDAVLYADTTSSIDTIKFLIDAGACINHEGFRDRTALVQAVDNPGCFSTSIEVIKLLLANGASVCICDRDGYNAYSYACENEDYLHDGVFDLISEALDIEQDLRREHKYHPMRWGWTPLMLAVDHDFVFTEDIVQLIEDGASLDKQNNDGNTALMLSIKALSDSIKYGINGIPPEIITILLAAGADTNIRDHDYGNTALMLASKKIHKYTHKVVRGLILAGADVDLRDDEGKTALVFAARVAYKTTECLLLNGANPFIHSYRNGNVNPHPAWSPLIYTTEYILENRSFKRIKDMLNIINLLISFGCDINYRTRRGESFHTCLGEQLKHDAVNYKIICQLVRVIEKCNKMSLVNVCARYIRAKSYFGVDCYGF